MLDMLKLFIEARDAPLKEVHFEGTLGPSFVDATPAEINKAVHQFLGIQDTPEPARPRRRRRGSGAPGETRTSRPTQAPARR